jgi:zinc protease
VLAERTLPNGLKVVVAKSTEAPLVSLALTVDAGSAADPDGKAGSAAMAAALSVRGDQARSAAEVEAALGKLGASLTARADGDGAVLSLWAPQANLDEAAAVMAEAAEHPALRPEEVERQRAQQLAVLAESMSQPRQIGLRLVEPLLYGASGYGRLATEASLAAITRDDLLAWRKAYWRPERSTLVITGGLTPGQGFALAERLFGGWAVSGVAPSPAMAPAAAYAPRVVVVDLPNSGQAAVMAVEPGVARTDAAYVALSAGNIVLSKAINEEVRVKRGLSYGGGSLLAARRDGGHVLALAQTKNESAAEVAELIIAEIDKYQTGAIDAETLRRRAALLAGAASQQIETTSGLADAIAEAVAGGARPSDAVSFGPALLAVTPEQVASAVRAKLRPGSASLLIVGDSAKFLDALKQRHPDVAVVKLDELRADPGRVR